jgi:GntR family transcriptional regulator/MocR family aminotransferase
LSYLVVPQSLVARFDLACRRTLHDGCPELMQAVVAEFIAEGHFARHIKRMRALYARRRALLVDALAPYAAEGFTVHLQDGGMHLLVDVPAELDDLVLANRAERRGLLLGFTNIRTQHEAERLVADLFRAFAIGT